LMTAIRMSGLSLNRRQKKRHPEMSFIWFGIGLAVDICAIAQLFAWLKVGNVFAFQIHFVTRFRVTSSTRSAIVQRKAAESPDFDAFALCQRSGHVLKHLFYCILNDFRRYMSMLSRQSFDQF
jgi:hypothetical protein